MQVSVVKVNGILWSGKADAVSATGSEGVLTVLPHHVPLVTTLREGRIVITVDGDEVFVHEVHGGILEITGERVTILL